MNLKPKKIWANFAVTDTKITEEFYKKLGFRINGKPTEELVSFLVGEEDFIIHFFTRERLQDSLEGDLSNLNIGNEILFSLSAESKEEVNEWKETVNNAGGKIHFDPEKDEKELYDDNGFYVLVFSDPDGHKFNVLFNPN